MMKTENKPKVLVLDDEPDVLESISLALAEQNYEVFTCGNPSQAMVLQEEHSFAVFLIDQNMPQSSGLDFLKNVRASSPLTSGILMTGDPQIETVIQALNQGQIYRFLAKPWSQQELLVTVSNAVENFLLKKSNLDLQERTASLNEQLSETNLQLQLKIAELTRHKLHLDQHNQSLKKNLEQSLQLCYHVVKTFHPLLGKQTEAIVNICEKMADSGILEPVDAQQLKVSAWIQNLGLVGISRQTLFNASRYPERLSPEEREVIEQAPLKAEALASFHDGLSGVGKIVRAAREKWDGRGYPDRLSGEMIPRAARYLAVAIAYVESGKKAAATKEMIEKGSGNLFDPEAVRLFFKICHQQDLPEKIKEITFAELYPGAKLANSIHSPSGLLLLPEDEIITEKTLAKIEHFNEMYPIEDRLLIYR